MQARLAKQQAQLTALNYQVVAQNPTLWFVTFAGPQTSPFEGGKFQIELRLDSFPFKGPTVLFKTRIYHPNINEVGLICPEIIGVDAKWDPSKKLSAILCKIKELMLVPNELISTNQDAGQSCLKGQWHQKAKNWTKQYAK